MIIGSKSSDDGTMRRYSESSRADVDCRSRTTSRRVDLKNALDSVDVTKATLMLPSFYRFHYDIHYSCARLGGSLAIYTRLKLNRSVVFGCLYLLVEKSLPDVVSKPKPYVCSERF
jgi:hypothetical protein